MKSLILSSVLTSAALAWRGEVHVIGILISIISLGARIAYDILEKEDPVALKRATELL